MYKDLHRIEDSIIPVLLEGVAMSHIRRDPDCISKYETMMGILQRTVAAIYADLPRDKRLKLYRRLDRVISKINKYFVANNFNTRKAFLALSEWARALLESGAIIISPDSEYWTLLEDMGEIIIINGYNEIPNFDKIDASAINHVPAMHKIAQNEGYFL